jgi:hypothetical protein
MGLDQPSVWVFPELLVCLNCGFMESSIPEAELRLLAKSTAIPRAPPYMVLLGKVSRRLSPAAAR